MSFRAVVVTPLYSASVLLDLRIAPVLEVLDRFEWQ